MEKERARVRRETRGDRSESDYERGPIISEAIPLSG